MSMLAAPRRKQRVINLRAKNNAWSNDSNKFGQRMLEKMGWSSGKGLGANENGMVEHVVARYKNDERGLGYEEKNDQWTKHEDDFNALLANLSNGDVEEEKLHSGVSLEDKSKKSKARVHYHKFTRGKDLTKYSEKDLANIFGKKSLKVEQKPIENIKKELEARDEIFTDKGSMEDYFKSKIAALKTKNQISIFNSKSNDDNDVDYAFRGFSGATNDTENQEESECKSFSFYGFQQAKTDDDKNIDNIVSGEGVKKKKKKKKDKNQENRLCDDSESLDSVKHLQDTEEMHEEPKKKKNKLVNLCTIEESTKKAKKSKHKNMELFQEEHNKPANVPESQCEDNHVPKKKKKKKNKNDAK